MDSVRLIHGDCLSVLPKLPAASVDMICADPPYGTTACKWDSIIPLEPLWKELKRIIKPRGAIVMTASQPFTTTLISSNREWFKYCWVWEKSLVGDIFNAKNKPLKNHEDVCVFSSGTTANCSSNRMNYYPQGTKGGGRRAANPKRIGGFVAPRPSHAPIHVTHGSEYPRSVLFFPNPNGQNQHPTQKPVALMEYLIRTYTNEGETVLDFCFGSGTTLVAALNTGRKGIGIERDADYFAIAEKRINEAKGALFAAPHCSADAL